MRKLPLDTTQKDIDIYAIVSHPAKTIYVWKCKSGNCYQAYKDHAAFKIKDSKTLFDKAEQEETFPQMYLLENIQTTVEVAFQHCIAWVRYFLDHGYQCVSKKAILLYADDLLESTLEIYDQIRNLPIEEVLAEERLIVDQFKRKKRSEKGKTKNYIAIHLSERDYETIKKKATEQQMTMSSFCKNMALTGQVVTLEPPPIWSFIEEVQQANIVLRQILMAIYQHGRYYPADLSNIQKMVGRITKTGEDVEQMFLRYAREVLKVKPK